MPTRVSHIPNVLYLNNAERAPVTHLHELQRRLVVVQRAMSFLREDIYLYQRIPKPPL